jgi:hypothetical protein
LIISIPHGLEGLEIFLKKLLICYGFKLIQFD